MYYTIYLIQALTSLGG